MEAIVKTIPEAAFMVLILIIMEDTHGVQAQATAQEVTPGS